MLLATPRIRATVLNAVGWPESRSCECVRSRVLPTESSLITLQGDQPVIGDGHAMRVASQVVEHMLWSAERFLGIYHPVVTKQRTQERAKDLRVCQVPQPSVKRPPQTLLGIGHKAQSRSIAIPLMPSSGVVGRRRSTLYTHRARRTTVPATRSAASPTDLAYRYAPSATTGPVDTRQKRSSPGSPAWRQNKICMTSRKLSPSPTLLR